MHESEKSKWSRSVVSDSSWPHGLQPTRLLRLWDFPGKSTGVGAIAFSSEELIEGKRPWCWERLKIEDETAGWHHQLDGRESEWAPGVGDGQGSLPCCVHGAAKSQTRLSDWIFRFRKLESKAMQPKSKQKKEIIKVRNYWHWKQDIKRIKSTNLKLGSLKTSSKLVNL